MSIIDIDGDLVDDNIDNLDEIDDETNDKNTRNMNVGNLKKMFVKKTADTIAKKLIATKNSLELFKPLTAKSRTTKPRTIKSRTIKSRTAKSKTTKSKTAKSKTAKPRTAKSKKENKTKCDNQKTRKIVKHGKNANVMINFKESMIENYHRALDKTLKALNFDDKCDNLLFTSDELNISTLRLTYTEAEILSLESKGRLDSKIEIIKLFLSKYGILLRTPKKVTKEQLKAKGLKGQYFHDETGKSIRIPLYEVCKDIDAWKVAYNIISIDFHKYDKEFITMMNKYDEYKKYFTQAIQV
jgi:hypothetical protein